MSVDPELNYFTSDPELLRPATDAAYERAAAELAALGRPQRLRIVHALLVGERTAQRAAVWASLPQTLVERELAFLAECGAVERTEGPDGPTFLPRDGHVVVQLHLALAHGRDGAQPRLLARRGRRERLARAG
ncbi:MAG TPA: hypothetical protein VFM93_09990 [Candidatus Limnocylindria bacterium]|nr:hypothetical protein [Candidatus Limnocylindria bacterium]